MNILTISSGKINVKEDCTLLTIIISNNHTQEDLNYTLKSIAASSPDKASVNINILNFIDESDFNADILKGFNVTVSDVRGISSSTALSNITQKLTDDYVIFANSGDIFTKGFFSVLNSVINSDIESKYLNVISVNTTEIDYTLVKKNLRKACKCCRKKNVEFIDLSINPKFVPVETAGVVFSIPAIKNVGINPDLKYDALKDAMYRILDKYDGLTRIDNELYISPFPLTSDKVNFPGMHDEYWYMDSLKQFVLPMVENYRCNDTTKVFVQYAALYELRWRYIYNQNSDNKHIVDKKWDEFYSLCQSILAHIDNNVIFNSRNVPQYNMVKGLCLALFNTKYGPKTESRYVYDNRNIVRTYNDITIMKAAALRVFIEILEYNNGTLLMEGSVDDFMDMSNCELKCFLDDREINILPTYRYAHTKYFGISTNKRYTFKIEIDESMLSDSCDSALRFYISYDNFLVQIPYATRRYTAKVASNIPFSYWKFGDNDRAVCFANNKNDLVFTKMRGIKRFVREVMMIASMTHGPQRSYRMFITRICYWLTRPYFKHKKIWLTYDKLYKGGDCGEYYYKFMLTQNDGITPAYVINRGCDDAKRLRKEGYRPLYFGTMKNRLYYLNADVVFATHGGVHSFNGFSNSQVKYVSDLIFADVTCIQHGLSVQQLAQELNRVYNNTKRYYCASKYEIKNLEHPIYGYEDKSVLRLTGIPRYDGLVSDDHKQILITPTWRAYISMPPVMGQSRPYYPEFKHTNYYKIYYNLLTDEKLINTARKTGYKLIYLLHPIISAQIVDYPEIDGVEIIPATSVNYEKILTESSLMLTDYSGVQFDFAYMRKPVVYYHPPKLPPHYKEGGFFYDSMGFGEICTEHQEMVDCLCEYMENNCELKPFYRKRADDFFAYSDLNSCKRIYDDIMEYEKQKKE